MRAPRSPQNPDHRQPSTGQRANRTNQRIVSISSQSVRTYARYDIWDELNPYCPFSYRSTGVTPALMALGHELQLPLDLHTPPNAPATSTVGEYTARIIGILRTTHDLARQHLKTYQEAEIRVHDQLRLGGTFSSRRLGLAPPRTTTARAPQQIPPPVGRPVHYCNRVVE